MEQLTLVTDVGAGGMGTGIAQVLAASGLHVALVDTSQAQLDAAIDTILDGRFGLRAGVAKGRTTQADADGTRERLRTTTDLADGLEGASAVVEAVFEDLALKLQLFRQLDGLTKPGTVLASNTAGLPITALAGVTSRPEDVIGWHFSQPVPAMRLAEIVRHPGTSQATIDTVVQLAARAGKNPIVVNDFPDEWGFVINRINRAVRREAARIVEQGVATPDQVDELIKDAFRWPMGPFEMQGSRRIGE
jgi:3-hydroxybutyryl-CoA dehydrogenase